MADNWADKEIAQKEYGIELTAAADIPKADCIIVAVGHKEYRALSMMQLKEMFKSELTDNEKILIDVKSVYRREELEISGMRYWRL